MYTKGASEVFGRRTADISSYIWKFLYMTLFKFLLSSSTCNKLLKYRAYTSSVE